MHKKSPLTTDLLISLGAGIVLGAILSAFSPSPFWHGFLGGTILGWLCLFALLRAWRGTGESRSLGIFMVVAFVLRIGLGIFFMQVLPAAGYDTEVQNAGFVYSDAFVRDAEAFRIASSNSSLITPFTSQLKSDQYGGLLAMTALVYRIFSPDAARPLLITLLAAFVYTLGMAFFWNLLLVRFNKKIAKIALWIMALYPESVLLGSSQMREPFLIGLGCIAFWAALQWQESPWKAFIISAVSVVGAILFSVPAGLIIGGMCLAVVLLEWTIQTPTQVNRWTGIEVLTILGFVAVISGAMWLQPTMAWDAYLTKIGSGMVDYVLQSVGEKWTIPFVTVYGLLQPVLPAAIFEPSLPIWTGIGIFRALGWYTALPFLLYAIFAIKKSRKEDYGWLLVFSGILFFVWVLVSSARAGGDQWDNPRYRTILLPWMTILISWALQKVKQDHSRWFWRWVAVVGGFVLVFSFWYATRTFGGMRIYPFTWIAAASAALAVVILAGGFIRDRLVAKREVLKPPKEG